MAYFDSAKNRVLWQRELAQLREERGRREREGYDPSGTERKAEKPLNSRVRKVSFAEFVRMDMELSGKTRESRSRKREMDRTHQKVKEKTL